MDLVLKILNNVDNPILLININDGNHWRKDVFLCKGIKVKKLITNY